MKSETIKVVFEYRIEYESEQGRLRAVREAMAGSYNVRGVGDFGSYAAVRSDAGGALLGDKKTVPLAIVTREIGDGRIHDAINISCLPFGRTWSIVAIEGKEW